MREIDNITTELIKDIREIDTKDERVNINIQNPLTPEDYMAIESIKKIRNPFRMIGVETVMKDLNVCKTIAYRLFQREDFPSINVGKSNQVMILAYMIWKMHKRV